MKRHVLLTFVFAALACVQATTAAQAETPDAIVDMAPIPLPCADRPTTVERACVVPQSRLLIETGYYQNASRIGSTALAAYPLTRLRIGVAKRVEARVDAPAQYAESGYAGVGLYPRSPLGIGAKWLVGQSPAMQYTLSAEASQPIERYVPTSTHSRYGGDIAAGLVVDQSTALNVSVGVATFAARQHNETTGFRGGVALRRTLSPATALLSEVTFRSSAGRGNGQTSGAVYLQQALTRNTLFDIGVGTAFNAAGNSKSHFLGFGFTMRPCSAPCS